MITQKSKAALVEFLRTHSVDLDTSSILDICRVYLDFYAQVRAEGIDPIDQDGDMVLFQWGRSEYNKRPDNFCIDIVRQFITTVIDDEYPDDPETTFLQLHCTVWFPPEPFSAIANGDVWLSRPADAAAFLVKWQDQPVLVQAQNERQIAYEIVLSKV